nr:MAG TPA: Protein transport protein SEC23, Small coat, vesicular transport, Cytoplasmic [Caudoviricetes sp.]
MSRCIDANALQAQLERKKADIANQRYIEGWNDFMMRVKSMVSKAPTIDVAPVVHGRWVHLGGDE